MSDMTTDDAPQTAMLLTDQEWEDLAHIVSHYRSCVTWTASETQRLQVGSYQAANLTRRHALATRIIEACS